MLAIKEAIYLKIFIFFPFQVSEHRGSGGNMEKLVQN
jgi:hypothetical protein